MIPERINFVSRGITVLMTGGPERCRTILCLICCCLSLYYHNKLRSDFVVLMALAASGHLASDALCFVSLIFFPPADPPLLGKGRAGKVTAPWPEPAHRGPDRRPAGYAGFVVDHWHWVRSFSEHIVFPGGFIPPILCTQASLSLPQYCLAN